MSVHLNYGSAMVAVSTDTAIVVHVPPDDAPAKVFPPPLLREKVHHIGCMALAREGLLRKKNAALKLAQVASTEAIVAQANRNMSRGKQLVPQYNGRGMHASVVSLMRQGDWIRPGTMVELGYSSICKPEHAATAFSCSKQAVLRARRVVALVSMEREEYRVAKALAEMMEYLIYPIAFDATDQRLTMQVASGRGVRSCWKVMVILEALTVGFASSDDRIVSNTIKMCRLPVPLIAGGSEVVYKSLFNMKCNARIRDIIHDALARVKRAAIFHYDRDGDATNDKVIDARMASLADATKGNKAPVLQTDHICSNHCNQLSEVAAADEISNSVFSEFYRVGLLVRTGATWTKLVLSTGVVLDKPQNLSVIYDTALPPTCLYNEELCDYLISNYNPRTRRRGVDTTVDLGDAGADRVMRPWEMTTGGREWHAALMEMKQVFPFPWHERHARTICNELAPNLRARDAVTRKTCKAVKNFTFRVMPRVPCNGKWTARGPAIDFYMHLFCIHPDLAVEYFEVSLGGPPTKDLTLEMWIGTEAQYLEEFHWVESTGKRSKLVLALVRSCGVRLTVVMMGLTQEGFRWLTFIFMRASMAYNQSKLTGDKVRAPFLLDLLDPQRSVVVVASQYFASLLCTSDARHMDLELWTECDIRDAMTTNEMFHFIGKSVLDIQGPDREILCSDTPLLVSLNFSRSDRSCLQASVFVVLFVLYCSPLVFVWLGVAHAFDERHSGMSCRCRCDTDIHI